MVCFSSRSNCQVLPCQKSARKLAPKKEDPPELQKLLGRKGSVTVHSRPTRYRLAGRAL